MALDRAIEIVQSLADGVDIVELAGVEDGHEQVVKPCTDSSESFRAGALHSDKDMEMKWKQDVQQSSLWK